MKLSPHFRLDEFHCRNGIPAPTRYHDRLKLLCEQLEVLREELGGEPVRVTSGYRTPAYNRSVGGAVRSQHVKCRAADIVIPGVDPSDVADTIERLIDEGRMVQGGLGRYERFTHYDIRGHRARWRG